jgi:hypothetical protein
MVMSEDYMEYMKNPDWLGVLSPTSTRFLRWLLKWLLRWPSTRRVLFKQLPFYRKHLGKVKVVTHRNAIVQIEQEGAGGRETVSFTFSTGQFGVVWDEPLPPTVGMFVYVSALSVYKKYRGRRNCNLSLMAHYAWRHREKIAQATAP